MKGTQPACGVFSALNMEGGGEGGCLPHRGKEEHTKRWKSKVIVNIACRPSLVKINRGRQ